VNKDASIRAGVLISEQDSDYIRDVMSGIYESCTNNNIDVIVFPSREKNYPFGNCEYQHYFLRQLISRESCDFLIVASGTQCHHIDQQDFFSSLNKFQDIPIVSIGIPIPSIPSIVVNNSHALQNLLEHLYTYHNRRKFAFVKGEGNSPEAEERHSVYCSFLYSKQLNPPDFPLFYGNFSYNSGFRILNSYKSLTDIPFDTLIVSNDDMAYGCIDYLLSLGIRIPDDIVVTGYDDSKRAIYNHPTLTTVNQQLTEQGRSAVSIGLKLLKNEEVPQITYISSQVRYRQTCGCVPNDDTSINSYLENGEKTYFQKDFFSTRELFRRRDETTRLKFFFNNILSDITLDKFLDSLQSQLLNMNITAAAVCLFDEPYIVKFEDFFELPKSIKLVLAYDELTGMNIGRKEIFFNPRDEFLPHLVFRSNFKQLTAAPLFHAERLLGYIIYRPGVYDVLIYEIFCTALSLSISTAAEFSKKEQERLGLAVMSKTDELTGLFNRRGFIQLSKQSINLALEMGKQGIIIYGDMDGLKTINDTYGHETGDRAIQAMASILKKCFRNTDICARLGGDEFAITAVNLSPTICKKNIQKVNEECEAWSNLKGNVHLSISLGYVEFNHDESDFEYLLNMADKKLYEEKKRKKDL